MKSCHAMECRVTLICMKYVKGQSDKADRTVIEVLNYACTLEIYQRQNLMDYSRETTAEFTGINGFCQSTRCDFECFWTE